MFTLYGKYGSPREIIITEENKHDEKWFRWYVSVAIAQLYIILSIMLLSQVHLVSYSDMELIGLQFKNLDLWVGVGQLDKKNYYFTI